MSRDNLWPIIIAALAGILVGGGIVWAVQSRSAAEMNARVAQADAKTQAALQQVSELTSEVEAVKTSSAAANASAPAAGTPAVASETATPPSTKKPVTVKQFAFVSKVNTSGSRPVITADYAQMLTGAAAAKAATAHGDESPPPDGYYIVNDNKLKRKLPVKSGISVTVTTNDDGTADPTGHSVTFAHWAAAYAAPDSTNASLREAPYWLTVRNGVVIGISEQYLP